ncbi:MAG: efflux RND transporter periplasmic adaptor subunit [Deltaproteobacteria bacterium]|nr:efflux RND transporter periplasmic adaptor subunit [Deltaproteobacteria bacterium]MBN2672764.1 efflux RND transporter periplasmic adaptor subunit [Deltaproteobacteria bacterium]
MKPVNKITLYTIVSIGFASLLSMACTPSNQQSSESEHTAQEHEDHHEQKRDDGHKDHNGEHEDHNDHSDLNRPLEELFSDTCEHGIYTYECDECRYEVGVVKVPQQLLDEKLVTIETIQARPASESLRLTGEIQFDERRVTHINTQVTGIIKKVHVTLGDEVRRGDPMLELESVEVGNARALLQESTALKNLAQQNYDRTLALRKEGIASEKEVLLAKQELDAAQIRTNAALGTLQRIGTNGGTNSNSGRLVLKSPADGRVLSMHAVRGEIADTNESLLTIGDNLALWVWADLYEKDYPDVLRSHSLSPLDATIAVRAFQDRTFNGVLDYISPEMDALSRTIKIRISVPNIDRTLLAGMFAEVTLFLPDKNDAPVLSAPTAGILRDENQTFIFIHYRDDYYVRRPVTIGHQFGQWSEVKKGMSGGEKVVVDGAFLLKSDVLREKMGAGCAH